ncbi:helix-turn-helix domain-containing protein [Rhodoferax aquaticus]|uniref:AraC family transcriptional regulator n=1 Tax=Rhodoferax aquaticus TaxID=2527691 RepID=A0A515EKT8_9BURK|nr:helix-turn-helix domain-containing protein [Rhodoferax aquaticus]QDL53219.1 AraC family transcriptional regulator [Rhodoferax aquaticus]
MEKHDMQSAGNGLAARPPCMGMNTPATRAQLAARGVLRGPQTLAVEHVQLPPCAALADRVVHFWHVQWTPQADAVATAPPQQATLPHPHWHWVVEGGVGRVYGVHTAKFTHALQAGEPVFGVKLKPGVLGPLANGAASRMKNTATAMQTYWPTQSSQVLAALADCDTPKAKVSVAQAFLLDHLPALTPQAARANAVLDAIAQDKGLASVESIGIAAGLDTRALQRLFQHYVGVSPKWVVGRYRIHEALEQIHTQANPAWADLALALGYFDQAHFINDFKALVGCTPRQYAKRVQALMPVAVVPTPVAPA